MTYWKHKSQNVLFLVYAVLPSPESEWWANWFCGSLVQYWLHQCVHWRQTSCSTPRWLRWLKNGASWQPCPRDGLEQEWLGVWWRAQLPSKWPWTPSLAPQGHERSRRTGPRQGTMVPGSTWPPPLGPEPSCSACALPVRGLATRATNLVHGEISWRSADPGYKQLAAN